jgi:hypothetical protein
MLTRDDFIKPLQRTITTYTLRDGRQVTLRTINELERSKVAAAIYRETKEGYVWDPARISEQGRVLLTVAVCDPAGNQILSAADVRAMGEADGPLIDEVADLARVHCRLSVIAKESETTAKNSDATTG